MKSFSQFLEESYLSEAGVPDDYEEYMRKYSGTPKKLAQMSDADFNARFENNPKMNAARDIGKQQSRPAGRRKPSKSVEQLKAEIDAKEAEKAKRAAARKPSGAAADPKKQFKPQGKTTTVTSPAVRPGDSSRAEAEKVAQQARQRASVPGASARAEAEKVAQQAAARKRIAVEPKPAVSTSPATPSGGKPPTGPKIKVPEGLKRAGRIGGRLLGPAAAALDVADERAKGSGWLRSGLKAAVVGGAGALGAAAGAPLTPVGSLAAGTGAAMAASKAFDVAAGANAVERKAMATANRQKQAGTAIKGIGGQTTFSQKKPGGPAFMSTGSGSQRKTVQLAKTGVVQRGAQSTAGHLAFKGGKAVYKAGPSAQSLAKTSSNPLERVGRTLFAGAYKKHDAAKAQQALQKARQNDAARQKALGVKALPGK